MNNGIREDKHDIVVCYSQGRRVHVGWLYAARAGGRVGAALIAPLPDRADRFDVHCSSLSGSRLRKRSRAWGKSPREH